MVLRERSKEPIAKSFIGLLYPLASFPLHLCVNARYEDFREGFSRTLKEQLARVLVRWHILKLRLKGYRIPNNTYTIVEEYCRGGR